jgi:glycosyltransferase involved in cell wall biosynthesis
MKKKLSCHIITYNQKDYIKECIEGVLMQKVNFSMEIIIGDDNSTDGTREILKNYANKYPDLIRLNLREVRGLGIPGKDNFVSTLEMCNGEYVSLCDGDDYWTDPLKLQKQVDFLEANHECNICFHRANLLSNNSLLLQDIPTPFDVIPFNYLQLLENYNFIATASVLYRRPKKHILPQWFKLLPFGDLGLYKIVSDDKKIACINEIMSVYRIHENGVFSGLNKIQSETKYLIFYKNIYPHLNVLEKKIVSNKIKKLLSRISKMHFKNKILSELSYCYNLMKCFKYL